MAAAQGKTNWFAIGVSIAVVAVLVILGGVVIWLNNQATAPGAAPQGEIINAETGAISFGEAEDTVGVYLDFMCPACGAFEDRYGGELQSAALADEITLEMYPIAILDHQSQGTQYSSRAASATYCVAEKAPESTLDFLNLLFANQPAQGTGGLSDAQIASFAEQAGAADAVSCIEDGTYKRFSAGQASAHQITGTPTVEINGERIPNTDIAVRIPQILG